MIFKKEIKKENYKAIVEIELLPYSERMKLIKSLNFKINNDGQVENYGIDQIDEITRVTKERIKSISVKYGNKKEITTLEELEYYQECSEILNECITHVMNGVKLGEV